MQELKRLRKKKKISCEDMGNMIGVSKVYYWQLENDKRRLTYDMAVKIAHVFNTKSKHSLALVFSSASK